MENVDGTATTSGNNVTTYTQPLEYKADGEGNLNHETAQYWPTSGNGLHIYGVYPSTAVTSTDAAKAYNATNISFSVQDDQSTDAKYNASDLMTGAPSSNNPVSRTSSPVNLEFAHLLSKIDITLTAGDGFTESDLSDAKVSILNTLPTTTFNVQNTTLGTATGTAKDITVCTGTKGSAVIVPQTVASGKAFIKVVVGGGSYFYKLASDVTFAGQKRYTYKIEVKKTGLAVTSSIASWTAGDDPDGTSGTATLEPPYVTFSAESEQGFTMKEPTQTIENLGTFEYSVDGGDWTTVTSNEEVTFGGDNGDLRLRGKSEAGTANSTSNYSTISFTNSDVPVAASGDIRTLVDYANYNTTSTTNARFIRLFKDCTVLTSAPALPATTLATYCYYSMFYGCEGLTSAPDLPATTLKEYCYSAMFSGCKSLKTAPELPATTLKEYCYSAMFSGCKSLETAPELPATTLKEYCYYYMFDGCSKLKKVVIRAESTIPSYALDKWLQNVASSGTIYKSTSLTLTENSTSGIPTSWTAKELSEL